MQKLPIEVVNGFIIPCLTVRDLQSLCTANCKHCRQQLQMYEYSLDDTDVTLSEVQWLYSSGISVVGLSIYPDRESYEALVDFISKHFPALRRFSVKCDGCQDDNIILPIALGCKHLEKFCCICQITDVGISSLGKMCNQLTSISLKWCNITDSAIHAICDHCPHLLHIGLAGSPNLTDASLLAIANTYPQLQSIRVKFCEFTDAGFAYLGANCHTLRTVVIIGNSTESICLSPLWAANPLIQTICLKFCALSHSNILHLVKCCPKLQTLELLSNEDIDKEITRADLLPYCPLLADVSILTCDHFSF